MRIMGFRSKYESSKPLYIYNKLLPLEANVKLNHKIYMETDPKSAPSCIQAICCTNSSTA